MFFGAGGYVATELAVVYTVWFPVCMAVSRFLAKPIQMNFAENKSWPTSVAWRGRPTQVRAGSMRAGGPTGSGSNSSTVTAVCSALRMEGQLFLLSGMLWHSAFSVYELGSSDL